LGNGIKVKKDRRERECRFLGEEEEEEEE